MKATAVIQKLLSVINKRINQQVNRVLHDPQFQRLESSWRGLWYLTTVANKQTLVRFLDADYGLISHELASAVDIEQTQLFKKIYTEELDQPGGQPFGLLLGDYYIVHKPTAQARDGIEFLRQIAQIAARSFTPFVSAIGAEFFGLENYAQLTPPYKLDSMLQAEEYHRWHRLRRDPQAHFVGLVLPRILLRTPYNAEGIKLQHRFFKEIVLSHEDYLWGNACYAYGRIAMQSFASTGWFSELQGMPLARSIGVQWPRHYQPSDKMKLSPKLMTECVITDNYEKMLSNIGMMALRDHRYEQQVVFYSSQTVKRPPEESLLHADRSNEKTNALLHYILCACRFAQYIKVIIRDKIGKFIDADECENFVSRWINDYCSSAQGQSAEALAKKPLGAARVDVKEFPGKPGSYYCDIYLNPHSQFDELYSQLHLTTDIKLT